jgi:hypothetical protein
MHQGRLLLLCEEWRFNHRNAPTSLATGGPQYRACSFTTPRRHTMLLAMSLLSSIAQSRLVRWLRAASTLPRRPGYH